MSSERVPRRGIDSVGLSGDEALDGTAEVPDRAATQRTADATPHASALIESLRSIGYTLETALADIVDNSITACAARVEILSETGSEAARIGILDDGTGMTEQELVEAMRPGTRNPQEERDLADLGRFGLGLKSASFSQCRRLTVFSRHDGGAVAATWDLDEVARNDQWRITLHDSFTDIPWSDRVAQHGTLVLWEKLDRLAGGYGRDTARRTDYLNRSLSNSERHLRLVFHRFLDSKSARFQLWLNGRQLKPIDPFASRHPACQVDPEERIQLSGGTVTIRSYTLPHHKAMDRAEWAELGGPEGHLKTQGFYVYRGGRLIISGSWLGLARQSEHTKLCRVRIDIPNSMDGDWKIDVKKASAQLPASVRERLKRIIERLSATSRRTYQKRGQKLVDEKRMPMWNRLQEDGAIIYRPNFEHPVLVDFALRLPDDLRVSFRNCVALIGSSLPVETLYWDMTGNAEDVRTDSVDTEALQQALSAVVPRLIEQGASLDVIRSVLREDATWRSVWNEAEEILSGMIGDTDKDE